MKTLIDLYHTLDQNFIKNTIQGGAYFYFVFTLGNLAVVIIAGLFTSIAKKIQLIYDFFGLIAAGSLIAMFVNMVLLTPFYLIFHIHAKPMFYMGITITAICYLIVLKYFKNLYAIGEALSKKET
jgi:hypothetical protein